MKYWQIAAGSGGRNYGRWFLRYGIAFVGGQKHIDTMQSVSAGDTVVLKSGTSSIVAAGTIVERNGICKGIDGKDWLADFEGWKLPAFCYVEWHRPEEKLAAPGLTRTTIQRIHNFELKRLADEIVENGGELCVAPEPGPTTSVSDSEILSFLVCEGLAPKVAEELTSTIARIRLLADYYFHQHSWKHIKEHETRTFLVVPLLLALGWAEQQLKIEYSCKAGRIDIACFDRPFGTRGSKCVAIIETKDFSSGLDYAPSQAKRYSDEFPSCKVVIVTNGYCYKSYLREEDGFFSLEASAYMNLLRPRSRYPLNPESGGGALDTIKWLLPNNVSEKS